MLEFADMDRDTLSCALGLVHQYTGIDMVDGKKALLQSRLRPRLRSLNLASFDAYLRLIQHDESERLCFIDAVTTHQTSLFRTPRIWQYLRECFLPSWSSAQEASAQRPLRVWSAATSTGEEACTLAICCEEQRRRQPGFDYEITATDISAEVLNKAAVGRYTGSEIASFRMADPDLFDRYNAAKVPECFMLAEPLRRRITFSRHNLLEASRWQDYFDLVLLRNVLIYFKPVDIESTVRKLAPTLRAGGQLIIGESESLTSADVPFEFVHPQVYRLKTAWA